MVEVWAWVGWVVVVDDGVGTEAGDAVVEVVVANGLVVVRW